MFSPVLVNLAAGDVPGVGQLSPRSPLTLSKTDKRIANIPLEATAFAFAYPLPELADTISLSDLGRAEVALAALGGFVYWDEKDSICGVNALQMGHGLNFAGPFPLLAQPGCRELRERLHEAGRVVKVTLGSLVACGVVGFSWISPAETFGLSDYDVGLLWPHGGFAYLYGEPNQKLDCLYKVTEAPQAAVDALHLCRGNVAGPQTNVPAAEIHRAHTLGKLGPFRPTKADFASIGLVASLDVLSYAVDLPPGVQAETRIQRAHGTGSLSPACKITLDEKAKTAALIPPAADSFAFLYPMRDLAQLLPQINTDDVRAALLAVGGFVYFAAGEIVGANALSSGLGLHFSAPTLLCSAESTKTMRAELLEHERVEKVQLDALLKCGVHGVAWLHPGESFGEAPPTWEHGAFVYIHDAPLRHRDVIYELLPPSTEQEMCHEMRLLAAEVAASRAERELVDEVYGNDILARLQRSIVCAPKPKPAKMGQLGPFKAVTVNYKKLKFADSHVRGASFYSIHMDALPAPPPPMLATVGGRTDVPALGAVEVLGSGSSTSSSETLSSANPAQLEPDSQQAAPQLSVGWDEAFDAEGKAYYWNTHTRETRWTKPTLVRMESPRQTSHPATGANAAEAESTSEGVRAAYAEGGVVGIGLSGRMEMHRLVFKKYDKDGAGTLSQKELDLLFTDLEHGQGRSSVDIARRLLDSDDDGEVAYDEFARWWRLGEQRWEAIGYGDPDRQEHVKAVADFFDAFKPASGRVSLPELARMHRTLLSAGSTSKSLNAFVRDVGEESGEAVALAPLLRWFDRQEKPHNKPPAAAM